MDQILDFLKNLKLGTLEGYSAAVVLAAVALTALAVFIVIIINGVKAAKENADAKESLTEDIFFAQYGVSGEEMRLNERLSRKRAALKLKKRNPGVEPEIVEKVVEVPVEKIVEVEKVVEVPVEVEKIVEVEKVVEVPVEKIVEVEKVVEVPAEEPVKEEPKPVEPVAEPAKKSEAVETPASPTKVIQKKPDDWSKYDGNYDGYYYDPEDGCYYEGEAPADLVDKLEKKRAEWEAAQSKGKKTVFKRVKPPFLPLDTPKHQRQAPAPVAGFDESVIYGKYVIEHAPSPEDGSDEYFYTLYNPSGAILYQSSNYSSLEYCQKAINRFKSHVIVGNFTVGAAGGKFYFVLQRKSYTHKGEPYSDFNEASNLIGQVKAYYGTNVIREQ